MVNKPDGVSGSQKEPESIPSCSCGLANPHQSRGKQRQRRKQSRRRKKPSWRNFGLSGVNHGQGVLSNPEQKVVLSNSKNKKTSSFSSNFSISRAFSPSILSHSTSLAVSRITLASSSLSSLGLSRHGLAGSSGGDQSGKINTSHSIIQEFARSDWMGLSGDDQTCKNNFPSSRNNFPTC